MWDICFETVANDLKSKPSAIDQFLNGVSQVNNSLMALCQSFFQLNEKLIQFSVDY